MNATIEVIGELNALIEIFKKNELSYGFKKYEHTLLKAVDLLSLENCDHKLTSNIGQGEQNFKIQIKSGTKVVLIDYRTIDYAQGLKDYTILHVMGKKYFVKGSVKAMEETLPKDYFIRVHKSFIVPIGNINSFHKNKIGLGSIIIPVGRQFRSKIDLIFKMKVLEESN